MLLLLCFSSKENFFILATILKRFSALMCINYTSKKYLILAFLLMLVKISTAQQDPQFSQNIFNNIAVNPGYAGSNDAICATALHRAQWMGFLGAPATTSLGVEAAIPMIRGGLGLNVTTDKIAQNEFLSLNLSYAYRIQLSSGNLGLGFSVGMLQDGIKGGDYIAQVQTDSEIPGEEKGSGFDLGAGLFYKSEKLYLGLSSTHINQPVIETTTELINMVRHYYLTAGYNYSLNESIVLMPSVFVKNDGRITSMDLNAIVEYNNRFWGGVTVRPGDAAIVLAGMHLNESLKFGISYDVPTSEVSHAGSLEFMLGYCFKIDYSKVVKGFKNPRLL